MAENSPGEITTKQYDAVDDTNKVKPMQCPLEKCGMVLPFFNSINEVDNYHKMVQSPLSPLFDDVEEQIPLPTGIPLESLQSQIIKYANISGGNSIEQALSKDAKDIIFMQELFDEIENILGTEDFLVFSLLFSSQAKENPNGGEFSVNYKGQTIQFEDAKFVMSIGDEGGIAIEESSCDAMNISNVYSSGGALCTDDFRLTIYKKIYIFSCRGKYIGRTSAKELLDVYNEDKETVYNVAKSFGLELIGERTKTAKEIAQEVVDTTLLQVQSNRTGDIIRDVIIEVADVLMTAAAIVTGTIVFKAAASAGVRAIAAGYMLLTASHMVEALDTLANRMIGVHKPGYNPLKEAAKYFDKKLATGHTVETCFDALNFLAVMGKTPSMKAITGISTALAGTAISIYSRGGGEQKGNSQKE
ncbi:hypothetical protein DPB93_25320 [Salmonella enterica subsp. salamae]|nr:hypothetical protein [Salmonella enterica subsp. salamae]ECI4078851.1 hypothetical protein [Salmonella enterica subsp. salamae]EEO2384054.1 hypothetical protein [Salmonella enterica]